MRLSRSASGATRRRPSTRCCWRPGRLIGWPAASALADAHAAAAQLQGDYSPVPARGFDWRPQTALAAYQLGNATHAQ
ncbi:MAG TPA: hypothetical protein VFQ77_04605 [Pseudonocardiaceae bacterium]|nr:hypothetical protein [Pseudonocardiaceae bacterium]